jgi:hypothetical protein
MKNLKNINIRFVLAELGYEIVKEKVKLDTYEDPATGRKIIIPKIKQVVTMNEAKAIFSTGRNRATDEELEVLRKHSFVKVKPMNPTSSNSNAEEPYAFPRRLS